MSTSILWDRSLILSPDNSKSVCVVINIFECSSKKARVTGINSKVIVIIEKDETHHLHCLHQYSILGVSDKDGVGLLPDLHKNIMTKMVLKVPLFRS